MSLRALTLALVSILAVSCSSTPTMELEIQSDPAGARVYMSLRGQRAVTGKFGPIQGDVKAEDLEEEFLLIGTAPFTYTLPLHETESDATVLGVGGKVVLKYKEGIVRFEMPGFQSVERHVRFREGDVRVEVAMPEETPRSPE